VEITSGITDSIGLDEGSGEIDEFGDTDACVVGLGDGEDSGCFLLLPNQ